MHSAPVVHVQCAAVHAQCADCTCTVRCRACRESALASSVPHVSIENPDVAWPSPLLPPQEEAVYMCNTGQHRSQKSK
eukprot:364247-Chlamydomonas_euryale.AAC.11